MVALVAEENSVILSAKEWRIDISKLLDIVFAGLRKACQRLEDLQGDRLLDAANVNLGLFSPDDALGHRLRLAAHLLPVGHGQAELREHFLMRDRLVVLEPFIGLGDGPALGIAQGVSVLLRRNQSLQKVNHGGELVRAKLIQQVVSVLSVRGHRVLLTTSVDEFEHAISSMLNRVLQAATCSSHLGIVRAPVFFSR